MVLPQWLEEEKPALPPVPPGMQSLLVEFAKEALKQQPEDLLDFGISFFATRQQQQRSVGAKAPPLRVIISGAPASGKGTQAARILKQFGVVHISPGDLLRAEVAADTELGLQAQEYVESGALVPDELVAQLVCSRLAQPDAQQRGWLLDGFPRTAAQCQALAAAGVHPDVFVCIEVPDAVLVDRVVGRRLDPETGDIYHLTFKPPPPGIEGRLVQRPDDKEDTVRTRIVNYKLHVAAVKEAYTSRMAAVDGDQPEGAVWGQVHQALERAMKGAAAAAAAGPLHQCA